MKEEVTKENSEAEAQTDKNEKEKLTEYASAGLRGPKFGIYEQLLCQHLVQSTVSSNPLRKIQLVVEGALMVDEEKRKALGIDMEKLEAIRAVTEAFQHRNEIRNKHYECLVVIEFGFTESEENHTKYIKPWGPEPRLSHYPLRLAHHFSAFGESIREFYCASCRNKVADDLHGKTGITDDEKCKHCGAKLNPSQYNPRPFLVQHEFKMSKSIPAWQAFFVYCHALSQHGYSELKNFFLAWAMPFVMALMSKLTMAVRPEIYNEIARMFVKVRKEAEK